MEIRVGAYSVYGSFQNKAEAKNVFLEHFPGVTEKDLDSTLDKLFKDADKSDNVSTENTDSDKKHASSSKGNARRQQPRED